MNMEKSSGVAGGGNGGAARAAAKASPTRRRQSLAIKTLSGAEWLDAVVALHSDLLKSSPEYLMPKSPEYFLRLLLGDGGVLLGAVSGKELAGFVAVLSDGGFAHSHAAGHITCPDDDGRLAAAYGKGAAGVMQSLCVGTKWMGCGVAGRLIEAAVNAADVAGQAHLFAQVADRNVASWVKFLAKGFAIVAAWESGHWRFLLRRRTLEEIAKAGAAKKRSHHVYRKDYEQLPAILAEIKARTGRGQIVSLEQNGDAGALRLAFDRLPSSGRKPKALKL